jgi:maleylpyruvate isomerase
MSATTLLREAIEAMPGDRWETKVERTPGGRPMRAASVPGMRWRELEIHHADLDAGYTPADWSLEFAAHLLDAMVKRLDPHDAEGSRGLEIRPLDSERVWVIGHGEAEYPVPIVTGPAGDVGWWLTGRGAPATLSCSHGELPAIEGW